MFSRVFRISKLNANSLLHGGLLVLLLVSYVCIVYVVVIGVGLAAIGVPFETDSVTPWWLNALAFSLIAAGFLPLARVLYLRTYDLVYAERDDAYAVVSRITPRLEVVTDPSTGLPLLAQAIAQELRLPWVAIEGPAGGPPLQGVFGSAPPRAQVTRVALVYQDQSLGALSVSTRGPNRPLTPSDLQLLQDVARQLSIAFHNIHLNERLQVTRERLVIAREEERRRIRNDLHDGLGPTLASLQLQLGALRTLIRTHPDRADVAVNEMRADLSAATAAIRQLVYDLRPPLLDELGLVAAIRTIRLGDGTLHLEVIAPDPMPALPAAVEVAAWRIAGEAIHNVVSHAAATLCTVTLAPDAEGLTLSVCDDGRGLPESPRPGVGLRSMRERATELGGTLSVAQDPSGGTCVTAWLPVEKRET